MKSIPEHGLFCVGKKKGRHIPEDIVWKYIIQCMRGVESLHAQKIIHRDIKPANVFVGAGDVMKIGDLGIAKILKNDSNAMTQIGTPFYMVRYSRTASFKRMNQCFFFQN